MSHLTTEQLNDLHAALTARYAEFERPDMRPPSRGDVHLIIDEYEDWLDRLAVQPPEDEPQPHGATRDGWRVALDPATGKWREVPPWEKLPIPPPAPDMVEDCTELADAWPDLPDLVGVDRFAEHPVTGAPDDEGEADDTPPDNAPAPDKPVGRARDPRVPDPDVARERLATALAQGSNGNARPVLRVPYPEPEPVDVARINQPRTLAVADAETLKSARMGSEERAAQYREIIAALQDMAVRGQMPSQGTWNADKPAHLPTHGAILARYNLANWAELAQRAKLTPIGRGNRPRKDAA